MIVYNLDVFSTFLRPTKAQAKPIIYSDTILPRAIPLEGFESIAGRHPQIIQAPCDLQLP